MRLKRKAAGTSGRKYKFVSEVNEQGFIEGAPSILRCLQQGSFLPNSSHVFLICLISLTADLQTFCQNENFPLCCIMRCCADIASPWSV